MIAKSRYGVTFNSAKTIAVVTFRSLADWESSGFAPGPKRGYGVNRMFQQIMTFQSTSSGDRIQIEAGVLYALINHRQDDRDAGHDARDTFTGATGHFPF